MADRPKATVRLQDAQHGGDLTIPSASINRMRFAEFGSCSLTYAFLVAPVAEISPM